MRRALSRAGAFSSVRVAPPTAELDLVLSCRLLDFSAWAAGDGSATAVAAALRRAADEAAASARVDRGPLRRPDAHVSRIRLPPCGARFKGPVT